MVLHGELPFGFVSLNEKYGVHLGASGWGRLQDVAAKPAHLDLMRTTTSLEFEKTENNC